MGTNFAPSYSNLFMGDFETTLIANSKLMDKIVIYKCYIDDLFFIWKGNEQDFEDFKTYLNRNEWGLSFTGKITKGKLEYLPFFPNALVWISTDTMCQQDLWKTVSRHAANKHDQDFSTCKVTTINHIHKESSDGFGTLHRREMF